MTISVTTLAKGTLAARYAIALAVNKGHVSNAAIYAERRYRGSPIVADTLKAAVTAGTPSDVGFGSALVDSGIASDFISAVRAQEVISRLPSLRRVPFATPTPVATGSFSAGWIAPGAPIPLSRLTLTSLRLAMAKIAAMTVVTSELLSESIPGSEEAVRRLLVDAAASASDELFLYPDQAPVADVSPGSITYGATEIQESGTNAAALTADLTAMIGAITTPLRFPVWIMRPRTWAHVASTLGAWVTTSDVRLLGFPVLTSTSAPLDIGSPTPSEPSIIALLDAAYIAVADDGQATIETARNATVQMSDTPTNSAATGTATNQVSLFQTDSVGIRVIRAISWARAMPGSVAFMRTSH